MSIADKEALESNHKNTVLGKMVAPYLVVVTFSIAMANVDSKDRPAARAQVTHTYDIQQYVRTFREGH